MTTPNRPRLANLPAISRPTRDSETPHSIEAEERVLGAVLLEANAFDDVIEAADLKPEDFFRASHGLIWAAILHLRTSGTPINTVSIKEHLEAEGKWERIQGHGKFVSEDDALAILLEATPHTADLVYLSWLVKEKAQKRALIELAREMALDAARNHEEHADQLAGRMTTRVNAIMEQGVSKARTGVVLRDAARARRLARGLHGTGGLPSGLLDLDDITGLFQPGQMILIAGRPSMGKSAVALHFAVHAATEGRGVYYASLEMSEQELIDRYISMRTGIPGTRLKAKGPLSADEELAVENAEDAIIEMNLSINDAGTQTVTQIHAAAAQQQRRSGLELIVVDYVQQLQPETPPNVGRVYEVAAISRSLKAMAKNLRVPVLACCALNRLVESREDKRPKLSDLRESGALEFDADLAIMLYRAGYYDAEKDDGSLELIIAKNRNGATGTAHVNYERHTSRLSNRAPDLGPYAGVATPIAYGDVRAADDFDPPGDDQAF